MGIASRRFWVCHCFRKNNRLFRPKAREGVSSETEYNVFGNKFVNRFYYVGMVNRSVEWEILSNRKLLQRHFKIINFYFKSLFKSMFQIHKFPKYSCKSPTFVKKQRNKTDLKYLTTTFKQFNLTNKRKKKLLFQRFSRKNSQNASCFFVN